MHSPNSSLPSKPSLASDSNLASTFLHNSSSQAPLMVLLLINLSPLRACCALDLVRWSLAFILRASRAVILLCSSVSDVIDAREKDGDLSQGNFRRILDVTEGLLPKTPSDVPAVGSSVAVVGVTLQTTMESSSSSSVTSTVSWSLFRLRSLRNIGSIAPPTTPPPERSSWSTSSNSNARLQLDRFELLLPKDDDDNFILNFLSDVRLHRESELGWKLAR